MTETKKEKHIKKITILHSNDMHGDFTAQEKDEKLIGGVSMLSGYIQQVRKEEKNTIYAIAGDMFRGSVIDSEYKGLSTIEIMNMLAPDVVTLGNHEVDYGIGHLLFLEKCARFPVINSNLYLKTNGIRLFKSHVILEIDGMKIMFIGILTEEVLAQARRDSLVGSFIDVYEAATEVGKICNTYQKDDIDLTVLLTHIGFEKDKELAEILDERWGIDLIIGGHSHTYLEKPEVIKGIPIVQAVTGTDQVGRFDIYVDTQKNTIDSYNWELIPIDDSHCQRDIALENIIRKYSEATEKKYKRYVTRFADVYTHPCRNRETQLGKLFADVIRDALGLDIMMFASGSLRQPEMGPIVLYQDLNQMFPFHDEIFRITVTGRQLKQMIKHIFRPEVFGKERGEFYQFSKGIRVVVSIIEETVTEIEFDGKPIDNDCLFRIGLQGYHFSNLESFFGLTEEEISQNEEWKILSTNAMDIIDEKFSSMELVTCPDDNRWITVE